MGKDLLGYTFTFSWFSGVLRKFFCEYKRLSLIVLNNKHLWPRQRKNISVKILMALKPWIFSPATPVYGSIVCSFTQSNHAVINIIMIEMFITILWYTVAHWKYQWTIKITTCLLLHPTVITVIGYTT